MYLVKFMRQFSLLSLLLVTSISAWAEIPATQLLVSDNRMILDRQVVTSAQDLTDQLKARQDSSVTVTVLPCTSEAAILSATSALTAAGKYDFFIEMEPASTACPQDRPSLSTSVALSN